MLQSLHIENVAVIERADISFSTGLTVLTGETGAGKSIVIDAINAVLGERVTREVVRHGAERAYVSAVFDKLSSAVVAAVEEQGFALEEDGTLLIQRGITADGKGSCRINGRPATVSALRTIGRLLVNIHGQHENQALLQPESHIGYLDRLGGLQDVRAAYEAEYRQYCRIQRAIKAAAMDEAEKEYRTATLTRQLAEIDAADLRVGEETTLLAQRELARHAGKIAQELAVAHDALDGDSDDAFGALAQLVAASAALTNAGHVAEHLAPLAARLQSVVYDVQACVEEIVDAQKTLAYDEDDLTAMEDRLAVISRLTRKYTTDEAGVLAKREELQAQLDAITSADEHIAELQAQSALAREATIAASAKLTAARKAAAVTFERDVCEQLAFLDMPHVRLEVSIQPTALTAVGGDAVEFLIASNVGEPAKSIARTASGGELSRIMLALQRVLADVDEIDTLVFDEVDSGISGRAATKVGTLLRQTAGSRQVLCVTHLAQMAAHGHAHLLVSKCVSDGRTFTRVELLDEETRCEELARIIGGEMTASAVDAAREMRARVLSS